MSGIRFTVFALIALAIALSLSVGTASAATHTVTNTNDSGPGSLRQAIAMDAPGDTVDFAPGLAGQTIALTSGQIVITKDVTIQGPAGRVTVVGDTLRVFLIDVGVVVSIADVNLTGQVNGPQDYGGAIFNSRGALLTLGRVRVFNSYASLGGGVYNESGVPSGTVSIYDSEFDHNASGIGGGAITNGGGTGASIGGAIIVDSSTLHHNTSGYGGALQQEGAQGGAAGGSVFVTKSVISHNSAGQGGAASVDGAFSLNATPGRITIIESTLDSNSATDGGAIYANYGILDSQDQSTPGRILLVERSALTNNTATQGGAIFANAASKVTVRNSTLSGNSSAMGGAAISTSPFTSPGPTVSVEHSTITKGSSPVGAIAETQPKGAVIRLSNTIVADQLLGADCAAPITSLNYNLDSDNSCNLSQPGDVSSGNANLGSLLLNPPGATATHAIGPDSDAYNKIPSGANSCGIGISTHQRGVARPQGSSCDIGAYEFECMGPCPAAPVGGLVDMLVGRSVSEGGSRWYAVVPVIVVALGAVTLIKQSRRRAKG
jgi:predicted outer membrane repeat protein